MPTTHSLALFLAAGLALNLTPGADMLYVAARSASEGRAAGVVSALGIGVGTLVHVTLVAAGLAALLAAVPIAYLALRLGGAAYLVYLGVRVLRGAPPASAAQLAPASAAQLAPASAAQLAPASLGVTFRQGVLTNVLNPKVALFFLAFLPQFVDPSRGNPAFQTVALGLLFDVSGTLVNLAVALASSRVAARLRGTEGGGAGRMIQRMTGGLFIALGARLAYGARP